MQEVPVGEKKRRFWHQRFEVSRKNPVKDNPFYKLHPALQKWIYGKGWQDLLPLQKDAIEPVLSQNCDVILSASTASGKTEAAFLPALTAVCTPGQEEGIKILYISPLKALINDQCQRLEDMSKELQLEITPWHGDIGASRKEKVFHHPGGVILTTPESLESLLINHADWLKHAAAGLRYFIIDEFHAFMDSQRGCQLQSQLNRIDHLSGHAAVRIALSATFGDAAAVTEYLRPGGGMPCKIIYDRSGRQDRLAVQIRGYDLGPLPDANSKKDPARQIPANYSLIAADIFRLLRGSSNLVFCNSRACTEGMATLLQELSGKNFVPNEFFPHHGSLARDLRENLERRLTAGRLPTTAICTSTLELGIDIANLASIAQLDPPFSVTSLRQRLGRSGRRDHLAVLRLFIPEWSASSPDLSSRLYENTVLSVAMINLLLRHWYEPPARHDFAFSTLLQQTLSVIASRGSASAVFLHELLCRSGTFSRCTPAIFAQFLKDLGEHELITQLDDGTLTLGVRGERLVSGWNFYAAFKTPAEYTIEHDHSLIGRIPLQSRLRIGDTFLFAGGNWKVVFVSKERRVIGVKPYAHETQPLLTGGSSGLVHDQIREEMFRLYTGNAVPQFLNARAREHFTRGLENFRKYKLDRLKVIEGPRGLAVFPWKGDKVLRTMILMLRRKYIKAIRNHSHLELGFTSPDSLKDAVTAIVNEPLPDSTELVAKISHLDMYKHDAFLSPELKRMAYAHNFLDIPGALESFRKIALELEST